MRKSDRQVLERALRRQRTILLKEVVDTEADLAALESHHDSELEEAARDDRTIRLLDRLDRRARLEVEAIDSALARMGQGGYGLCLECEEPIALARLRALPATPLCIECAARQERAGSSAERAATEPEAAPRAALPPELNMLSDRELQRTIVDQLQQDERLDLDHLRIVCRHGVVYVDGRVPSAGERQILLHTLNDVLGLSAVEDRVRVELAPWEREERRPRRAAEPAPDPWPEPPITDDVIEASEDGTDYEAPDRPPPDEE